MPEYDLPDGPRQLLEAVRVPLARAFGGENHLRLGGGTTLAARWNHRHSTDVDIFVEPEPYRHFHWNTGGRFTLDLTAAAPVDRLIIDADGAYFSFQGLPGHVSVAPALHGLPGDPRSADTVAGTDMPLETTAEILAKKLYFRMARRKELLARDLYDIAFARRRDPAALQAALDVVDSDRLAGLVTVFEDHRANPEASGQAEPVLAPVDPRLAEHSTVIVERLVIAALDQRGREARPDPELTR